MTIPTSGTTPRPWVVQVPGDKDPGAGTVFIDTHAYPDGPEPVVTASYPLGEADANLIVYAVNHIEQAEAERNEATELLTDLLADGIVANSLRRKVDAFVKRRFLAAHPAQPEVGG